MGQKQGNIWYFGDHAGLDFNNVSPVALTNGETYSPDGTKVEGTAVISDSSGSLLFYTNGMKIWNKNQQVMPNGDNLLGDFSSTQSALIVPQPNSSRYFYVFTTDCFQNNLQNGFRYSVVDICLNNGMGDVIPNQKNIKLIDTVSEKLTAVRHANGMDYWIIVHKYYSDAFYSYHLSAAGIVDTVISHIGSRHPNIATNQTPDEAIGELKASPNGNKIAIVTGNSAPYAIAEYFNFDKNTGLLSNWVNLQTNTALQQQYYYGVCFSPDNSKLYITSIININDVYQFDLNAGGGNADSVSASITNIATNNYYYYYGLQLGTDGKIYLARSNTQYLSAINNPNNTGANCNFQDSAIYLNGEICGYGLPNFIDSYDYANTIFKCQEVDVTEENLNEKISISPNPCASQTIIHTDKVFNDAILDVYNSLGQQVKQIKNIFGSTIILYRDNLLNGVYFIRLTQNNKVITTNKLIIMDN